MIMPCIKGQKVAQRTTHNEFIGTTMFIILSLCQKNALFLLFKKQGKLGNYFCQKMCPKLGHIYFIDTESSSKHDFLKDNLIDAGTNIVHLLYPRHLISSLQFLSHSPFFFHLLNECIASFRCLPVDVSKVLE